MKNNIKRRLLAIALSLTLMLNSGAVGFAADGGVLTDQGTAITITEPTTPTGEIPPTTGEIPPTTGEIPPTTGEIPPTTGEIPPTTGEIPPTTGEIPPTTGEIPPTTGEIPPTTGEIPPTTGETTPPAPACDCPTADGGEVVHVEGCSLYAAPQPPPVTEQSDAAKAVLALINALPTMDELTVDTEGEGFADYLAQLRLDTAAARTAHDALTEEEKATLDPAVLARLTELEGTLAAMPVLMSNAAITITINGGTAVGGTSLENAIGSTTLSTITTLTITAGEVTADDWKWFAGGTPGNTTPVLEALTDFAIDESIAEKGKVVAIPDSGVGKPIFPTTITTVTIPQNITIGDYAFTGCTNLTTAIFPTAAGIDANAFDGCTALTTISFPKVALIGRYAFTGCTNLTTASFPDATGELGVGDSAFDGCIALITASFPKVTAIGISTFKGCTALTTASFPNATKIYQNAFDGCTSLATLTLGTTPPTVTNATAFTGCPKTTLILVNSVGVPLTEDTFIKFSEVAAMYDKVVSPDTGTATDGLWYGWTINVPIAPKITIKINDADTEYGGADLSAAVTAALNSANINTIKKLTITKGEVTASDWTWFKGGTTTTPVLTALTDFTVDAAVTAVAPIPSGTSGMPIFPTTITAVTIPQTTSIGGHAFRGCTLLASVEIPQATGIGQSAFQGCTKLTSVSFSAATSIEGNAFRGCTALTTTIFPQATGIGEAAFYDCTQLKDVTISKATSIGNQAFQGCTALTSVSFPLAISIGRSAFNGCSSLAAFTIPSTVTTIGYAAFSGIKSGAVVTLEHTGALPTGIKIDSFRAADTAPYYLVVTNNAVAAALGDTYFSDVSYAMIVSAAPVNPSLEKTNDGGTLKVRAATSKLAMGQYDVFGLKDNNEILTTYNGGGYSSYLCINSSPLQGDSSLVRLPGAGVESYVKGGIWAKVDTEFVSGGKYLQVTYTLRNSTNATISNVALGVNADVKIGTNDSASIFPTATGFRMVDTTGSGMQFTLNCKNAPGVDNVNSMWYGAFGQKNDFLFTDLANKTDLNDTDSGLAFSWKGMNILAGESITRSVVFGVNEAATPPALPTDPDSKPIALYLTTAGDKDITVNAKVTDTTDVTDTLYYTINDDTEQTLGDPVTADGSEKTIAGVIGADNFAADGTYTVKLWIMNSKGAMSEVVTKVLTVTSGAMGGAGLESGTAPVPPSGGGTPTADAITITVNDNATEHGGASLQAAVKKSGARVTDITKLTITAGEVTADDWTWFKGGTTTSVVLTKLTDFTIAADVTVADMPDADRSIFSSTIVNVNIPQAIKIGMFAFSYCKVLTTASIPAATSIGDYAFSDCTALTTANFPVATGIGAFAFDNCIGLTSQTISAATSIGKYAFSGCTALTSASFPVATGIGKYAFSGCTALTSASFPVATGIGKYAFSGCTLLATTSFPLVAGIGVGAFSSCTSLATASFPVVTSIEERAFSGCTLLATLKLGTTVPTVGRSAFNNCPKTTLTLVDASGNELTGNDLITAQTNYKAALDGTTTDNLWYGWTIVGGGSVTPPTKAITITVNDVATEYSGATLQSAVTASNVTVANITKLTITKGEVTATDWIWFKGGNPETSTPVLTALTHFTVDAAVTTVANIPNGTFWYPIFPNSIVNVTIAKVTKIGEYAFSGCTALTGASFPAATSTETGAFYRCTALTGASFPAATTIGDSSFFTCTALTTASFPAAISIGKSAFESCTGLTTASFPAAKDILTSAFSGCELLTTIDFTAATSIGNNAFDGCEALATASFAAAIDIGKRAFSGCTALTTASFPLLASIGEGAFNSCTKLTTTSFPLVASIGLGAFHDCKELTSISFPAATSIGKQAFQSCKVLVELKLGKTTPPTVGDSAFWQCPDPRSLVLVDASGVDLKDTDLTTAQGLYKAAADGKTTDNLWWDWTIVGGGITPPTTCTCTLDSATPPDGGYGAGYEEPTTFVTQGVATSKFPLEFGFNVQGANIGGSCPVTGHSGQAITYTYTLTSQNPAGNVAVANGNANAPATISFAAAGNATVRCTASANGKTKDFTATLTVTAKATSPAPGGKLEAPLTQDMVDGVFGEGNATLDDTTTPPTIKLEKDITPEKPIELETDVNIDLGGNTITGKPGETPIIVGGGDKVTIDGSGTVSGGDSTTDTGGNGITGDTGSDITVGGGVTVEGGDGTSGGDGITSGGSVTVDGGTVTGGNGNSGNGGDGVDTSGGTGDGTINDGGTASGGSSTGGNGSGGNGINGGTGDITIDGGGTATGGNGSGSGSGGTGSGSTGSGDITVDGGATGGNGGSGSSTGGSGGNGTNTSGNGDTTVNQGGSTTGGNGGNGSTTGGNGGTGSGSTGSGDITVDGGATGGNGGSGSTGGGTGGNGTNTSGGGTTVDGGATGGNGGNGNGNGSGGTGGNGAHQDSGTVSGGGTATGGNGGNGAGTGNGGNGGTGVGGGAAAGGGLTNTGGNNGIKATTTVDDSKAGTTVTVPDKSTLADAALTEDEKKDSGITEISVTLNIEKKNNQPDKDKVDAVLNQPAVTADTIGAFFDITLDKIITNAAGAQPSVKVAEASNEIEITITIPTNMRDGSDYVVIRVHGGVGAALPTSQSGNNLTFKTDKFSTYAIAYTQSGGGVITPPNTSTDNDNSDSKVSDAIKDQIAAVGNGSGTTGSKDKVVTVKLTDEDMLSESMMEVLRQNPDVSLVIKRPNGQPDIIIPAGKAPAKELGRLYWSLEMLAKLFAGSKPPVGATAYINPKTGGSNSYAPHTVVVTARTSIPFSKSSQNSAIDDARFLGIATALMMAAAFIGSRGCIILDDDTELPEQE